jgi:transposase-like protein
MLKVIDAQEGLETAEHKSQAVIKKLSEMNLAKAVDLVKRCIAETLIYYHYPDTHWLRISNNNPLEQILHEIIRRT